MKQIIFKEMTRMLLKLITSPVLNYGLIRNTVHTSPTSVFSCDNTGLTPLHLAVKRGYSTVANLLLAWGAPVNVSDDFGRTPLHIAVLAQNSEMVKLLLQNYALANAKTEKGHNCLHLLALTKPFSGWIEIANNLLDYGAYAKEKDNQGLTPIDYAILNSNRELLGLLQKA